MIPQIVKLSDIMNAFGSVSMELAAAVVVNNCLHYGNWNTSINYRPFHFEDEFGGESGEHMNGFLSLVEFGWLRSRSVAGEFYPSTEFIRRVLERGSANLRFHVMDNIPAGDNI